MRHTHIAIANVLLFHHMVFLSLPPFSLIDLILDGLSLISGDRGTRDWADGPAPTL